MHPEQERSVVLTDGTRLWTVISGAGSPVVLCHGGPGLWDYLSELAALLDKQHTVVRFEQRGCGRSTGREGPFTIAQAVDDLEQLRRALSVDRWGVLGHSWGAELALRYAAQHPERTTAVAYIAGVGAGRGFRREYVAERGRRLGTARARWQDLDERSRTPAEEREWCLLQWSPDFSPAGDPAAYAEALWRTRPDGVEVNRRANRQLSAAGAAEDLLTLARDLRVPVTMVLGADDPRPWTATDELVAMLPNVRRLVLERAGHAPWTERPADVQALVLQALHSGQLHLQAGT